MRSSPHGRDVPTTPTHFRNLLLAPRPHKGGRMEDSESELLAAVEVIGIMKGRKRRWELAAKVRLSLISSLPESHPLSRHHATLSATALPQPKTCQLGLPPLPSIFTRITPLPPSSRSMHIIHCLLFPAMAVNAFLARKLVIVFLMLHIQGFSHFSLFSPLTATIPTAFEGPVLVVGADISPPLPSHHYPFSPPLPPLPRPPRGLPTGTTNLTQPHSPPHPPPKIHIPHLDTTQTPGRYRGM